MTTQTTGVSPTAEISQTPGAKMMYLIKRRPSASREELVAHWFANHMPAVVARQERAAAKGRAHARRYIATLFGADTNGLHAWDGVAQLWWDEPLPPPAEPHGTNPTDSFQERAEPYVPWATTEHVVLDGQDRLAVEPLTLNDPFPTSRSGFVKVTALIPKPEDGSWDELFAHWLGPHAANVRQVLQQVGGFRYAISLTQQPDDAAYAGMAELYFPDLDSLRQFGEIVQPDGMERWTATGLVRFRSDTEFIGIV